MHVHIQSRPSSSQTHSGTAAFQRQWVRTAGGEIVYTDIQHYTSIVRSVFMLLKEIAREKQTFDVGLSELTDRKPHTSIYICLFVLRVFFYLLRVIIQCSGIKPVSQAGVFVWASDTQSLVLASIGTPSTDRLCQ